ncbi:uncharacterized protein [Chelonus insularis]|uniref:uncharacterized protein n=1 Tax=Chelonus insularis TaxID=460826 RepID=UPI00158BF33D|nr:uncharacterized protein LOC118073893 [Chelonus insularis]
MKSFILFLSICLKVCLCWHFSRQDNEFNYDESITKNPWLVMIVRNGQDVVSYGTLFHERAVATTAAMNENNLFQLQVFADCHSLGDRQEIDHRICKQFRNVSEYDVIGSSPPKVNYYNFAVLILSSPFELTPTLNVVHFGHQSSVQSDHCIVLYPTLVTNPNTNKTGALFYPTLNINWTGVSVQLVSSFEDVKPKEKVSIVPGSPLLCKSKTKTDEWYAIAIVSKIDQANKPSINSRTIALSFTDNEIKIFLEILKNFQAPGDQSEVIFYYD